MGMLAVVKLADQVEIGTMSLTDAVSRHLTTGFIKSIRVEWLQICTGIIERYKGGDHDLSYKIHAPGKPDDVMLTAESIIEDLHLEPFVGEIA